MGSLLSLSTAYSWGFYASVTSYTGCCTSYTGCCTSSMGTGPMARSRALRLRRRSQMIRPISTPQKTRLTITIATMTPAESEVEDY